MDTARLAAEFVSAKGDPFTDLPSCVLFVGINGAGKTTTVGKLAGKAHGDGVPCLIGGADTFRAAAIEQLQVWGKRASVDVVTRERGADPASVCYDVIDEAERRGARLVLIDTAGRLHTSADLMRELAKVVNVTRKRCASMPVSVVLVIDATTGQNGLNQAKEFNQALDLDGLIVTKLDGTAKGGIALAISHQLGLPIFRIGVGETIDDPIQMYLNDVTTIPVNLAGVPGISVPSGLAEEDGLPVGIQFVAPAREDARLYRVGAALETLLIDSWGGPLLDRAPALGGNR